ncbi:MAG: hypothetical protein M3067_06140 [Chloroflexota bacterium]|nr:hypothetical protein [Chloroflexota bacterium]
MTVRHVPDVAETGAGDDGGGAVVPAVAPGSGAGSEAGADAAGTSVDVADVALGEGAADGPNEVGAGLLDPWLGAPAGVAPPHAATTRAIVANAPTNLVPAPRTTIRRGRIEGL